EPGARIWFFSIAAGVAACATAIPTGVGAIAVGVSTARVLALAPVQPPDGGESSADHGRDKESAPAPMRLPGTAGTRADRGALAWGAAGNGAGAPTASPAKKSLTGGKELLTTVSLESSHSPSKRGRCRSARDAPSGEPRRSGRVLMSS